MENFRTDFAFNKDWALNEPDKNYHAPLTCLCRWQNSPEHLLVDLLDRLDDLNFQVPRLKVPIDLFNQILEETVIEQLCGQPSSGFVLREQVCVVLGVQLVHVGFFVRVILVPFEMLSVVACLVSSVISFDLFFWVSSDAYLVIRILFFLLFVSFKFFVFSLVVDFLQIQPR